MLNSIISLKSLSVIDISVIVFALILLGVWYVWVFNYKTSAQKTKVSDKNDKNVKTLKHETDVNLNSSTDTKTQNKLKILKYSGPKYSRISNRDIKTIAGKPIRDLSKKEKDDIILTIAKTNRDLKISPYSVYIPMSEGAFGKLLGYKSPYYISKYFRNEKINPKQKQTIEDFLKNNRKGTKLKLKSPLSNK